MRIISLMRFLLITAALLAVLQPHYERSRSKGLMAVSAAGKPTLAVLYFQNTRDNKEYEWLRKGFTDMLITELVGRDAWHVVERERMQEILKEMKLGMSGVVDEKTAQQVGKILGVSNLLRGSYIIMGDKVVVDLHLVEVQTCEIRKTASLTEKCDNLLALPAVMARKAVEFSGLSAASAGEKKNAQFSILDTSKLFYDAMEAYDNYKFNEAEELLKQALIREPDNPRVNYFLGEIYLKKVKVKTALVYLEKAAILDPEDPRYHFTLGKMLIQFYPFDPEKKKQAISELEKVIMLSPRHDQAYVQLGWAFRIADTHFIENYSRGRITELQYWTTLYDSWKRSVEYYRKALEIEPDNYFAEQALDPYSSNMMKDLGIASRRLGILALKSGDCLKAAAYLEECAVWEPEYGETYYYLGKAFKGKGDPVAARKAWSRYLELDPRGEYCEEVRKELGL